MPNSRGCHVCSARQHVPLEEYKQNLGTLIDRLQALGAQVVVITPAPVDEATRCKLSREVRLPMRDFLRVVLFLL